MVAAGLFVWLIRWMERTVQQEPVKTRAHAVSIGMTIREVERVRPIFDAQEGFCMRRMQTTCNCVEAAGRRAPENYQGMERRVPGV